MSPRRGPSTDGVAIAAGGAVWTSLVERGELACVAPGGRVSRVRLDAADTRPTVLAVGPDAAVWFSRGDGRIGRVAPGGAVSSVPVLTPVGSPYGLCAGPGQTLWYTLLAADRIGRITPDGQIEEFPLAAGSMPSLITASADGTVWFTLHQAHAIGSTTPAGGITTDPLPTIGAAPVGIHAGREAVWFTEIGAGQIGRIFPGGGSKSFRCPTPPVVRTRSPPPTMGGCWATVWAASSVVRLDEEGRLARKSAPRPEPSHMDWLSPPTEHAGGGAAF